MQKFKLTSTYKPTKEQLSAIKKLEIGVNKGVDYQVLLGVTGSGKTFTVANLIEKLQKPTLIISHNKTLAGQLYQEFRDFFPDNSVNYFVSYYDYYQPEAYIPSTDTYIEKDAGINELIDKLRLATTANLLTRKDTIVVASVSCIYNIGSPKEYKNFVFTFKVGTTISRENIIDRLVDLQYDRGDFGFHRGTFRVKGDSIDIYPAYQDTGFTIEIDQGKICKVNSIDPVSGEIIEKDSKDTFFLYPAKHFMTDTSEHEETFKKIFADLDKQVKLLKDNGKELEAHRLKQKVTYEMEMLKEVGYVKGIENYSMYFDKRKPGDPPFTLLDYFKEPFGKDWLVIVDESHITFPQVRGMYQGDRARKTTLVDYGFRLPSSFDNRPLTFDEFMRRIPNFIATTATPSEWELSIAKHSAGEKNEGNGVVEQLMRPTGIPDPLVEIRPVGTQVKDVIKEVKKRASMKVKERSLITTLTKRTAEDLAGYLNDQGLKVHYLHSDVKTLERGDILDDLRKGTYDCLIGVNLLREGLDLPEVSLVAILDADKEGFLRSEVSLIQTMGRAARHVDGKVILYADKITGSMERALGEVRRRREYQLYMNKKLGIKPTPIKKPIRERLIDMDKNSELEVLFDKDFGKTTLPEIDKESLTPVDRRKLTRKLRTEMRLAAKDLNFEFAAEIRDRIRLLES
ncbi:excinuclease ABC subunit UvrB [Candidatus Woesebacteria bacterium]|nr:MAG: excinuclease ABC subunit UvrB [Candidatus Woesebacteria bacterium]